MSRIRPYTSKPINGHTEAWVPTRPPETLIPKEKCFRIVDKLPRHHHVFRGKFRRPLCVRLNETQLLQMLKDVGGYNPRYVAINKEAACNFTDLSQDVEPLPRNLSQPARQRRNTKIRQCWRRGSFAEGTHLKRMCTECAADSAIRQHFPAFHQRGEMWRRRRLLLPSSGALQTKVYRVYLS